MLVSIVVPFARYLEFMSRDFSARQEQQRCESNAKDAVVGLHLFVATVLPVVAVVAAAGILTSVDFETNHTG